jgi:hypothetical protein
VPFPQLNSARHCFLPPIPELDRAADLLSDAVDALIDGRDDLARELLRRADMPVVHEYATRIMGKEDALIHRYAPVERGPLAIAGSERQREAIPATTTRLVVVRDGWRCRYCGCRVVSPKARDRLRNLLPGAINWSGPDKELHGAFHALTASIDHVLPWARGGDNSPENLVTSCRPCNFGRMDRLLTEANLADPRDRPPFTDSWDGLCRVLTLTARPAAKAVPVQPTGGTAAPKSHRAKSGNSEAHRERLANSAAWFARIDTLEPGLGRRIVDFVTSCERFGVSYSVNKVMIVRMRVAELTIEQFGIEPNGEVSVPWLIGGQKKKFKKFAEDVAAAMRDGIVVESKKQWIVKRRDRTKPDIRELLAAADEIRQALGRLYADLGSP